MFKSYLPLLAFCLGCSLTAQAQTRLEPTQLAVPAEALAGFNQCEIVTLDHASLFAHYESSNDAIKLNFVTSTGPLSFELNRWDQRSANHHLITSGSNRHGKIMPRKPAAQYSGRESSADGGRALFTLDEQFVLGSWKHNGHKYHLEPLFRFWPAAPRNAYLFYRAEDVKPIADACAVDIPPGGIVETPEPTEKSIGECFEVEIALAADFLMFQQFGNNVSSVENFMLGVLADVQTNYDDEFEDEIQFIVSTTEIITTSADDPWTTSTASEALLPDFRSWGNSNDGFTGTFDVASLWTGRSLDAPTIGRAYIGALCTNSRYGVLQNFSTNANSLRVLWAHELGHNFGSDHDTSADGLNFIMAPSVNGSSAWSAQSIDVITAHYRSRNCLLNCVPPEPPQAIIAITDNNICAGSQVAFFNETTGRVNEISWSFPGGTPATSDNEHPIVAYSTPGTYTATLTVSNQFGSNQENMSVTVSDVSDSRRSVVFYENFEEGALLMTVENPNNNTTWQLNAFNGNRGSVAAFMNNFENDFRGESDFLLTPRIDLSDLAAPRLEFEYAYRRFNANFNDELRVLVSVEGGAPELIFTGRENGSQNFATGPDLNSIFIPDVAEDWCGPASGVNCISLDLSDYLGEENVVIALENLSGFGNIMVVDNVSVFGNCTSVALPVEWLSYTARRVGKTARLDWEVNQDEAHAGFFVERSDNGESNWQELGWVPSGEQPSTTVAYNFSDDNIGLSPTYYYRLRQHDLNGTESLSEVRSVSFPLSENLSVWPNPTGGLLEVRNGMSAGNFELYNALGQRVLTGQLPEGNTGLDLGSFAAGVYLLRVDAGGEERVVRVVRK